MDKFNYNIKAEIIPSTAKSGDTVTAKVYLSDVEGEVKNVYVSVPAYGIWEVLRSAGDNTYTLNYTIPWMAPYGKCEVNFYATSVNGQRGPSTVVQFYIQ
ncbi:MAG: hypothetical protein GX094_04610 [Clostridiales bacterium]|jgi:hypothetical protein|nr:hypothetical protein [Clostridiales bacterium]